MFYLNNQKLIMYDIAEYGGCGAIGTPSGSNSLYSVSDLPAMDYPYTDTSWDRMYTTMRATRDAFAKAVHEYILSTLVFYKDKFTIDETSVKAGDRYLVGITENNLQTLFAAMNDIWQKFLESYKWEYIYWNFFIKDKYVGQQSFTVTITSYDAQKFAISYYDLSSTNSVEDYYEIVHVPININFDIYQALTSEVYENYINSFKEYIFTIKKFIVMATGTTFEQVEEQFDFTKPFVPPYTPPSE